MSLSCYNFYIISKKYIYVLGVLDTQGKKGMTAWKIEKDLTREII